MENKSEGEAIREANQCIGLGLGVGGIGAASGLALGAVCPLCYVVAPGLVGVGLLRRWAAKRRTNRGKEEQLNQESRR